MPKLDDERIELEWIKDEKDGSYRHDQFRILPSEGKFALEIVEGNQTGPLVLRALKHIVTFGPGRRLLDVCYGPKALPLRTQVLAILLDRKINGSSKEVQWGNFRKLLLSTLSIEGTCIADEDAKFEEKAKRLLSNKPSMTQACKGPLKVCKGFALDISEGRLVKLESGNWGSPPAAPEVKTFPQVNPFMQQYQDAKAKHPDMLLLFRVGDVYESFDDDADSLHKLLGITLTSRGKTKMAGFPHHQLEVYLQKLLKEGQRVAICEQVQDPGNVPIKKVVTRVEPEPTDPCGNEVKPNDPDFAEAINPVIPPLLSIAQACDILGRELPISSLPPGSHFVTSTGIFGRFIELIGMDAKVELEKGSQSWSNASPVYWLPCKVKGEAKVSAPKVQAQPTEIKPTLSSAATESRPQATPTTPKVSKPRGDGIFGQATKRVVMSMAVKGFTEEEIIKVTKHFNSEKSPSSIRGWSKSATRGKDGEPAALTPDQLKQLKSIVGKK